MTDDDDDDDDDESFKVCLGPGKDPSDYAKFICIISTQGRNLAT